MLAGEKVLLYLSRLETLVEQINDLRKDTMKEHLKCVEENSIDEETYQPSEQLRGQITTLYGMVRLKEEFVTRIKNYLSLYKIDPEVKKEDLEDFDIILDGFKKEGEQDKDFLKAMKEMNDFKGSIKVILYDDKGELVEEIVLSEDEKDN